MATKWISPTWRMPEESNQSKFENYSLNFNGTDDEINCGNSDAVNITGPISISVWFNADNITGARGIVCKNDAAAQQTYAQYFFDLLSDEIRWRAGRNTVFYGINTGQWYHAVGVYDGSDITLYIDGTSVATDSALSTSYASSQPLYIGRRLNQDYFEGEIGQVAIYDSALSASQVSNLWNSGTPVNPMALTPLPTAYYPLGGGSTGDAADPATTLTVPNESVPSATVFSYDDDKIDIPQISLTNNNTISIWAKRDDVSGADDRMMLLGSVDLYGYGCYFFENSTIYLKGSDQVAVAFSNTAIQTALARHDWVHWVFVKDSSSGTLAIYVDGDLAQSQSSTSGMDTLNTIGNRGDGGNINQYCWHGEISNTQAWDTNLSPSEITTLYNNGVPFTGTQPQASNLKAWYKMNVDTSTWNGSDWIIGEAQANYSSALDFDGTNDDVTISNVNLGTTHTISFWMKSDGTGRLDMFCNSYGQSRIYGPNVNGSLFYNANGTNQYVIWNGQQGLNDNNWHHMCFVRNGTSVDFYADSVLQTVAATAITATDEYQFTNFMHPPATSRYTKGTISNLAVFTTALDLAAVQALYNNGTPQTSPSFSPTGWWKLNNTTTGIQDSVGSNNGTNNGATVTDIQVSTLNGTSSGMTTANLVTSDLTRSIPYSSYSMVFDSATDDYINVGTDSSLNVFDGDFSISIWFNHTNAAGSADAFLEFGAFTNKAAMTLGFTSNTGVGFAFGNPSVIPWYYNAGSGFNDGNWHNMVATRTGTTYKIFVDGVDLSYSTGTFNSAGVNRIGTTDYNTFYNGKLSNVAVFGSTLTEDQVLTIYNGGVPNDISSLSPVSWWSLAGDSYFNGNDWICPDLGSASNNGTSGNMGGEELVGDGPGSTANGTATSMDIPANLKGNAPNSSKNAFSVNMNSADRVEDVPA